MAVDASIIIPVFNNAELTRACIERVIDTTAGLVAEIVVVDNASTDQTAEMLAEFSHLVRVVSNTENVGFTIASNQGAAASTGRHLVFLNNDTLPEPEWLDWLVQTAERDGSVGAVGSKLVYPDGSLQEAGGIVFSDGHGWNYGRGGDPNDPRFRYVREVDYCSAASLLVKREVFEALGGFDERYAPAYFEDSDLCFGVRSLGKRVLYQPRSVVVHLEGRTAGTDTDGSGLKRYQVINHPKFVEKWKRELEEQYANSTDNVEMACYRGSTRYLLYAHPTMPAYDISSGDLRTYLTLKILAKLGARVTFVSSHSRAAQRAQYIPELEQCGIEVYATDPQHCGLPPGQEADPHPLPFQEILFTRKLDGAVMSHFDTALRYVDELRFLSPRTAVYLDTHDVHFLRELRQAQVSGDDDWLERARAMRRAELVACCRSDVVLTVTEEDKQVLLDEIPRLRVEVTPNIHDPVEDAPGYDERDGILFIGYFGHTPNVDAMRWFVADIFPLIRKELPGVKFWMVGSHPTQEIFDFACDDIEVTGFVPETRPYLDACRISIAPLRYGAGMKGKVGEALQSGIPVVTTSIGAEGMGLAHERDVLIADEAEDFAREVVRLYSDSALWRTLAVNGKQRIAERYSTPVVTEMLRRAYGLPVDGQ